MDPAHDTSPDESALPNVPPQPQGGEGAFALGPPPTGDSLETPGAVNTSAPVATPASAPPATPPPASAASSAWLPPTAPVSAGAGDGQTQSAASSAVSAPGTADDGDVIEKEWVEKAKQIVNRTRQDPYNQTRELHKFKAEYMQKRYNKTIKAVEE